MIAEQGRQIPRNSKEAENLQFSTNYIQERAVLINNQY